MPRRTNILLVDDNAARRKTLSAELQDMGHRVTVTTAGQEAIALFQKQSFNIVLAGIKLPDASGREIMETVRELDPEVVVIMIADDANRQAAVHAVDEGAYAYLLGPEATYKLKIMINNALREQELLAKNRRLVESLQQSNKLLSEANEKLKKEIAERKQAEDLLRQSEEKYRRLFELSPIGITTVDMKGVITDCNSAVYETGGYSAGELVGRHFSKAAPIRFRDIPKYTRVFGSIMTGKAPKPFEVTYNRKDGTVGWSELHITLLEAGGKKLGVQVIQRDITDRKLMEQEIRKKSKQLEMKNRELERASRAKSDFLAKMSHELRTPLNVILGFAELMLDRVPGEINEEQRQCLDDILTSGRHLLVLINEVLDLSKVEAGKVELKLKNVSLAEIVGSVTGAMTAVISQRRQSLDVDLERGLPLVKIDEARLKQVFFNLLSNASNFTPDGGEVRVEVVGEGDFCRVTVSDNGVGIKKEDLKQVFEPFYQADNSLDRGGGEGKGTGLGLALVKEIIEMHGGKIWVESKYRKGSRFIFTLPLATAHKALAEVLSAKEDTGRRG